VNVAADSFPLVILAKLGCFDLLHRFYPRIYISPAVHNEVVVVGAGLPRAAEVANAAWSDVKPLRNQAELLTAQEAYPLGLGEISTILLADEIPLDDYNAGKLARAEGFHVRGSFGLLEAFYRRGELTDLRTDLRLRSLNLPPL
jgi:uncharacterized protein